MARNITLTECNLASLCCDDSEVVYPLTLTSQVILEDGTTLAEWIANLDIHPTVDIEVLPEYTEGMLLASVDHKEIYAPKIVKDAFGTLTKTGIVTINENYFDVNEDNELIPHVKWSYNNYYGNEAINIGNVIGYDNKVVCPVTMPKPSLFSRTDNNNLIVGLNLGIIQMSAVTIPHSVIHDLAFYNYEFPSAYSLSLNNNTLILSNNSTVSTVELPIVTYTAGTGITIDSNNVISADGQSYTAGEGINITTSNVIEQTVATDSTLGGIKIGYTGTGIPVELDANNQAFVTVNPIVNSVSSNGLSMHYFRVGTSGGSAINIPDGYYLPLMVSSSSNLGKRFIMFEVIGREDSPFYYGKFIINVGTGGGHNKANLVCLCHFSTDLAWFKYNDIVAVLNDSNTPQVVTVYRKIHRQYVNDGVITPFSDDMFIVNVLAENTASYSTQHYYHIRRSSTKHKAGYGLANQNEYDSLGNLDVIAASTVWQSTINESDSNTILAQDAMRNYITLGTIPDVNPADYIIPTT